MYGYIKKDEVKEGYYFWLALLNSKLFWFFIKNTGYILRGGYFTFKSNYIYPFPIPSNLDENLVKDIEANSEILYKRKNDLNEIDYNYIENKIDNLINKLYKIAPDEINLL